MEIKEVGNGVISHIAKQVFGNMAKVESISEIKPTSEDGIPRVVGCNKHLAYIVRISGDSQGYVFRFSKGYENRKDRFDEESKAYALIAEKTSIPTPRIHAIDRTLAIAPTPYMVMDYILGDTWRFLAHADNPRTGQREVDEILWKTGAAYAQIHNIERKTEATTRATTKLLSRLEQLRHVVEDGQYAVDLDKLDACGKIIESDKSLLQQVESLCVEDAEIHFRKVERGWEPSFICDMEWVGFGDPYLDLAAVCAPKNFWDLDSLFVLQDASSVATWPFFRGYETTRPVDYDRLRVWAAYSHFSCMCSIVGQVYRDEKRAYMKAHHPRYVAIVDGLIELGKNR